MKIKNVVLFILFYFTFVSAFAQSKLTLVYTHPNAETSIAGRQAAMFADLVKKYSDNTIIINIYPNSQLGTLTEQEQLLKSGMVAFTHNTASSMGSLYEDFEVLDTPFIYTDVDHLLRVTDPSSPVMKKLNAGILKKSNVRVLASFYFGTRQLTADRPIKKPADLKGLKIRAIPFPIYKTAVEAMGAIPVPLDWVETAPALKAKKINGQENPANTIVAASLWESQNYLMLTNHIIPAEVVVMNNDVWKKLTKKQQEIITKAAKEATDFGTKTTIAQEADDLARLKQEGMEIITEKDGLDIKAFKKQVNELVKVRFGKRWSDYYKMIEKLK